jgi:hypothetical protein
MSVKIVQNQCSFYPDGFDKISIFTLPHNNHITNNLFINMGKITFHLTNLVALKIVFRAHFFNVKFSKKNPQNFIGFWPVLFWQNVESMDSRFQILTTECRSSAGLPEKYRHVPRWRRCNWLVVFHPWWVGSVLKSRVLWRVSVRRKYYLHVSFDMYQSFANYVGRGLSQ